MRNWMGTAPLVRNLLLFIAMLVCLSACKSIRSTQYGDGDQACVTCPAGYVGKDGADGSDGRNGRDGKDGLDGQPGPRGLAGRPGQDGKTGAQGPIGATGDPGAPGKDGRDGRDAENSSLDLWLDRFNVLIALLAWVVSVLALLGQKRAEKRAEKSEQHAEQADARRKRSEVIKLQALIQSRIGELLFRYLKLRDRLRTKQDPRNDEERELQQRIDKRTVDYQRTYDAATEELAQLQTQPRLVDRTSAEMDDVIEAKHAALASVKGGANDVMLDDMERQIDRLQDR